MASSFTLTLDTTAPATPTITLEGGAGFTATRAITAAISTTDSPTTGYQMKIWGDVDTAVNANIQGTEALSAWFAYGTSQAVTLSTGDGVKTINIRIRDDVLNESAAASDTITLDTTVPIITITGPDVAKLSKIAGKDTASFSFSTDIALQAWKVKVVPATGSLHDAGTQIPITAGSTNMSGGAVAAAGTISATIKATDLETASVGDGEKIVKVFGQESGGDGSWSV